MGAAQQRREEGEVVDGRGEPERTRRWHVITGLALIHGHTRGAELGVSQGRFTTYLCSHIPALHMTAVDLWAEQPGNQAKPGGEDYLGWNHEANYQRFLNHVNTNFPGRVTAHRMTTLQAADLVPDDSLDFIFIDADHSYESTLADIRAWTPKVKSGGLIAGHDSHWPTVNKAVMETGGAGQMADHVWVRFKP